jgi:phosphohistidine phosphatase
MNSIYIVRHAKAGWGNNKVSDFERKLTDQGRREATEMARRLFEKGVRPDLIVSSPACRALETAEIFAGRFDYEPEQILQKIEIYEGDVENLAGIVRKLPRDHQTIIIFGHNPAISQFASWLSGKLLGQMETCGVVQVDLGKTNWSAVRKECGQAVWNGYPKTTQ